jgi:hypothetical protein
LHFAAITEPFDNDQAFVHNRAVLIEGAKSAQSQFSICSASGVGSRCGLPATAVTATSYFKGCCMKPTLKKSLLPIALAAALAMPAANAFQAPDPGMGAGHNFDRRPHGDLASSLMIANPAQASAISNLNLRVPELRYEIDSLTGATTTLMNNVGFLTGKQKGDTKDIALSFIQDNPE